MGSLPRRRRARSRRRRRSPPSARTLWRKSPSAKRRRSRPAVSTWSAPNATRAGESTISCAAVPAGKAIPAAPASSSRSKTTSCAFSARRRRHRCLPTEDDLMRIFGSQRMDGMLQALGLKEDESIVHPWINKALEKAQAKVEARNFDIRKNLLKYDNVMNDQRKAIFDQRRELLSDADLSETIADMRRQMIDDLVADAIPEKSYAEQWDVETLTQAMKDVFGLDLPLAEWAAEEGIGEAEFHERLIKAADEKAANKAANFGPQVMRQIERAVLLQTLDNLWREHLVTLEHLRQVIGLRGYGQ